MTAEAPAVMAVKGARRVRPLKLLLDRSLFPPKIASSGKEIVRIDGRVGENQQGVLCCADCQALLVPTDDEYWVEAQRLECPLCSTYIILA